MDKNYLNQVIQKIEYEKAIHNEKFAGNPAHENCLPRFDAVLQNLQEDVDEGQRLDFSPSISALPDAIEPAAALEEVAKELAAHNNMDAAEFLKRRAEGIVAKELNELDGFDR